MEKDVSRKTKQKKYDSMTEDEKIEFQKKKLKRQFSQLDSKTKNIVSPLIDNAAFMTVTLEELQKTINEEGIMIKYQNGANQWGKKKSPAIETYNSMIKNLSAITKQLTELVPRDIGAKDDGFDTFLKDNM